MAVAGIQLNINTDELRSLRDNIRAFFPRAEAAEVLGEAIEKAIWPAYLRLREVTPVGPTGMAGMTMGWLDFLKKALGYAGSVCTRPSPPTPPRILNGPSRLKLEAM